MKLCQELQVVALAYAIGRRGPFSHPVHCEHCSILERRRIESAGGVRLVVFGEKHHPLVVTQLPADYVSGEQLLLQPDRHRGHEGTPTSGRHTQIILQDTFKLQKRLIVKSHIVNVLGRV